jgi:hypothetical protein
MRLAFLIALFTVILGLIAVAVVLYAFWRAIGPEDYSP